jgi:signal transduction histidine kinase
MSASAKDFALVLVLALLWLAWIRTGQGEDAKTTRGRLREFAWCVALAAIGVSLQSTFFWTLADHNLYWVGAAIPVLSAAIAAWRPRLAARIVPAALIVFGLYGFVLARNKNFFASGETYLLATAGAANTGLYLVLPEAYALIVLGGWLSWRSADRESPWVRRLLGRLAQPERPGQLWALLLLPVVFALAALVDPNIWLWGGPFGLCWTTAVLVGTAQLIRRSPDVAAGLAVAGLALFGIASLYLSITYLSGDWTLPVTANGYVLDGLLDVSGLSVAHLAVAQAIACLAMSVWLIPRAAPGVMRLLGRAPDPELTKRLQRLTESRAVAVDTAAADLRRLERDLHDGAQARLVALGMSLRAVERLIPESPEAALALVAEARETSARALMELRELVRGVHPPVLADRGLADAVRALALDCPLSVDTDIDLPGRLPAPIETACYFTVAELLTNAAKHSGAQDARITMSHGEGLLRIVVTDFGLGGADPAGGSGLAGVERRLATFDGILAINSPAGGPTMVVMEVPCALSSPKTSSC